MAYQEQKGFELSNYRWEFFNVQEKIMTNMKGQWRGCFSVDGVYAGILVLNVEVVKPFSRRLSFVWNDDKNIPYFHSEVSLKFDKGPSQVCGELSNFVFLKPGFIQKAKVRRVQQYVCQFRDEEIELQLKRDYPCFIKPCSGELQGELNGKELSGTWKLNNGMSGCFFLKTTDIDDVDSKVKAGEKLESWEDFLKTFKASTFKSDSDNEWIFRGQVDSKKKMRTSFHRTGRNDLYRYLEKDVDLLENYINTVSSYVYKIRRDDKDLGALLYLGQHYGYPTPFLDWTESPYVAAYFAFKDLSDEEVKDKVVRIFAFNRIAWEKDNPKIYSLYHPMPIITVRLPALRAGNERALPQQSVPTYSNVDDMEDFIDEKQKEKKSAGDYLLRFDLPVSLKEEFMKELRLMGIHAGSLFPGMEGICKSLKEKYFSD